MATDIVFVETEEQRVQGWRMEVLERAGYDRHSAILLARRKDVDLHEAISLVQKGCSPELGLQILL